MTDEGKYPKDKTGDFPSSLKSAKNALPTFPPPRRLLYFSQNLILKGASSATLHTLSFRLILRLEKTVESHRTINRGSRDRHPTGTIRTLSKSRTLLSVKEDK